MTTPANPTDEIIELTEIVEEGVDIAAAKLDSTALDQELDSLLLEVSGQKMTTDAAFEPEPKNNDTSTGQGSGNDLDDELEDLFESFKEVPTPDESTALDLLLDTDQGPSAEDDIELGFEEKLNSSVPQEDEILDLAEESIIELTEMVVETEAEEFDQAELQATDDAPENTQAMAVTNLEDVSEVEGVDAPNMTEFQASWDALNARLDSLEKRLDKFVPLRSEQVLSVLPTTAQDLPFMPDLQENILAAVTAQLAKVHKDEDPDLRQDVDAMHFRLTNLEARPVPEPMSAAEIVAALPDDPVQIPALATLNQSFLSVLDTRLTALDPTNSLDSLRQEIEEEHATMEARLAELEQNSSAEILRDDLAQRLDALEAKSVSLEEVLTVLPSDPEQIPALATLNQDLQTQITSLSSDLTELKARPSTEPISEEVESLRNQVLRQDEELRLLREDLEQKEAALVTLRQQTQDLEDALTQEKSHLTTKIREEVLAAVQNQIPAIAAQVIREEISTLVKELEN